MGKVSRRDENQSVRITGSTARINVLIRDTYRAVQRQSVDRPGPEIGDLEFASLSGPAADTRKLACADDSVDNSRIGMINDQRGS